MTAALHKITTCLWFDGEGGDPTAQQCGWLEDRYGLSWQIVPEAMDAMSANAGSPGAERAMAALLTMKKLDVAALQTAYDG